MKLKAQEEQSRQRSWQGRGINDTFSFSEAKHAEIFGAGSIL